MNEMNLKEKVFYVFKVLKAFLDPAFSRISFKENLIFKGFKVKLLLFKVFKDFKDLQTPWIDYQVKLTKNGQ